MEERKPRLSKEEKKEIKALIKQKKYDEVFFSYGQKAYNRYVPTKEKNRVLNKYSDEGRYEDIFLRFGEKKYNEFLISAIFDEIKMAKGLGHAFLWRTKYNILKSAQALGLVVALGATALPVAVGVEINNNSIAYSEEIQEYIEKNNEYAESVKKLNLNDLETFMLVTNDMWENIAGYANPEKDIAGFLELDLDSPDGFGVCRNMSKDVQKKLNMINPRYNARTLIVRSDTDGIAMPSIQRKFLNEEVEESLEEVQYTTIWDPLKKAISGNHEIVLVDIPDKNITLSLDPTNPSIGVYDDGKIVILNPTNGDNTFEIRGYNTVEQEGDIKQFKTVASDYIKSYLDSGMSMEELINLYGIDAQETALKSALEKRKIIQKQLESFEERIKYEPIKIQVDTLDTSERDDKEKNFGERY